VTNVLTVLQVVPLLGRTRWPLAVSVGIGVALLLQLAARPSGAQRHARAALGPALARESGTACAGAVCSPPAWSVR
jgi:hypothetical protein